MFAEMRFGFGHISMVWYAMSGYSNYLKASGSVSKVTGRGITDSDSRHNLRDYTYVT
jgi:hypothetical protein